MKKIISGLLAAMLVSLSFSACNNSQTLSENPSSSTTISSSSQTQDIDKDKFSIVTTTFPQYDWVRQILGDKIDDVELTLLMDDGVDLHSYQPTVDDIAKISTCDMFIYVGGESDTWVNNVLDTALNKDIIAINMVESLGDKVKEEEIIEGMEHDHGHSHEIDANDVHDRPLSDWAGTWATIENALESGALDEYIKHNAEESGNDFEVQKASYSERWKSEFKEFEITDSSIDFGNGLTEYKYAGYKLLESDSGSSVWYGFEAANSSSIPRFIAFNDHGTGGSGHDEDEHDDHEDEHDTPHFHLRYGNESLEALTSIENWSPTFFLSDATGEEIAEAMSGHSHGHESDEHVWLSLKNAEILATCIQKELATLDSENASTYAANLEDYTTKLTQLDNEYKSVVDNASNKTLLFGDRFPFRYLVDDYNISYFAAFSGCSAESEASFETVAFLSNKTDELNLKNIMVIENSDQSIAKTIIDNTSNKDQKILVMDSIQSVTSQSISSGDTYLSIMERNLEVLKEALA